MTFLVRLPRRRAGSSAADPQTLDGAAAGAYIALGGPVSGSPHADGRRMAGP